MNCFCLRILKGERRYRHELVVHTGGEHRNPHVGLGHIQSFRQSVPRQRYVAADRQLRDDDSFKFLALLGEQLNRDNIYIYIYIYIYISNVFVMNFIDLQ